MTYQDYAAYRADLESGKVTAQQAVTHYLEQIEAKNPQLNAFLEVYAEEAREQAKAVDQKISQGNAGKLAGMVIGLKDVLCYKDHGLQAASKILEGFQSQFSGTAVERLLEEDAIIIGRQNCDEFAMGTGNENSAFGPVKNIHGENRSPGGSSGGSAVSVAAGMCMVSLGSDTGGSVRQPASFCGIYGLKPTYSRISRHGLIAFASSFDIIGLFANNAYDTALVLEVIAGADDFDATVSSREVPAYAQKLDPTPQYRIGYIRETLEAEGLQPEVRDRISQNLDALRQAGHVVDPVSFPLLEAGLPTYYVLTTAEASTNLSRYDGVRFGYRSPNTTDVESLYKKSRSEGFGAEVRRRILLGTFVLSADYHDAYFTKAQRVRRLIREQSQAMLQSYDVIISPTAPTTAFEIGSFGDDVIQAYLADLFTVQASVAGLPAISIPTGQDANGLPIGMQIMTDAFEEAKLLAFSQYAAEVLG